MCSLQWKAASVWVLSVTAAHLAAQPRIPATVEQIVASHRAARESITSLTCKVEVTRQHLRGNQRTLREPSDYQRKLDVFRVRVTTEPHGSKDIVFKDSVVRGIGFGRTSAGESAVTAETRRSENHPPLPGDPWALGLMVLPVPNRTDYMTFEALAGRSSSVRAAGIRMDGAREMAAVEMHFDRKERP